MADDVELTVRLNFTDQNWFGQVVVWQHDSGSACQVGELLARKRVDDGVNVGGACRGYSVHPHVKADVVRFHRVVRHARIVTDKAMPCVDEGRVFCGISRHEVVPSCQVANEVGGIEAREFFFTDGEGNNWDVFGRDALGCEFFVEADVCVAVDGRNHANRFTVSAQCDNVGHDGCPVRVTERGVVHKDVFSGDAFGLKIAFENVVGGAWVDIVGAQKREFLNTKLFEEVVNRRDRLLVRSSTRVENVARGFFAFVLNGVEQQAVQFFKHGENRFTRDRGPVAENHIHVVNGQQFTCLFRKERPVGRRVDHNGFDFTAQQTALCVLLCDQHQHGVFESGFRNGHRAREGVQHANLDRVSTFGQSGACTCDQSSGGKCGQHDFFKHLKCPLFETHPRPVTSGQIGSKRI